MKMKTFKAASMREALLQVKRELGGQAVILGTRSYRTGGFLGLGRKNIVEVTASLDATPGAGRKPAARSAAVGRGASAGQAVARAVGAGTRAASSADAPLAAMASALSRSDMATTAGPRRSVDARVKQTYGQLVAEAGEKAVNVNATQLRSEIGDLKTMVQSLIQETRQQRVSDVPAELLETYTALLSNEVADEMARELVRKICEQLPESEWRNQTRVRDQLVKYVASRIEVAGPMQLTGPTPRAIAFIGPTGVGKTTTIAKLAAQLKLRQGHSVGLVTIDTFRIGAVDQLRTYAEILEVPLKVVLTPRELRQAVDDYKDMDYVLIDTAGRSQRDVLKMNQLKQFLEVVAPVETHLVISSTCGHQTASSVIDKFSDFQVDRVVLTKLDEAVGFGMVLTVLEKAKRKLSYVTAGQDVPDDIEPGEPRKLAELIIPCFGPKLERATQ